MNAIVRRSPTGTLTVFDPFYHPFDILEEVEAMARRMFDGREPFFSPESLYSLDVYREKDDLVVKAELPGVEKKDLDISLEDDRLTIKAEKKQEEVKEDADHYISERHFGQYSRTIKLPFPVNEKQITATLKNGLLEVKLPKAEEAKTKQIEIKVE
jgi:HSP20 family protein